MWTQIRLLLQGRSDLDLRCLSKRLQNVSTDAKTYTFIGVARGSLTPIMLDILCTLLLLNFQRSNSIGTALANSAKCRGIRQPMYIEDLL